jgi:DNA adenine methylase Dam
MSNNFIKSPINYSGNKYKLLRQMIELFPNDIKTFVDVCGGSFTVGLNVHADNLIYNEIDTRIANLVKYLCESDCNIENDKMQQIIKEYGLGKNTKEEYTNLRNTYNENPTDILLFLLSCFSFNYQIRFNGKGKFNMPCGNRGYSKNMQLNYELFNQKAKEKQIKYFNKDFKDLELNEDCFVYVDPPYLQTIATYTEGSAWNLDKEQEMYQWLDELTELGIKWALSNTVKYRGEDNEALQEWSSKYNVHKLDFTYKNNNRWNKDNSLETVEVLITNY